MDTLERARPFLPEWVPWAGPVLLLGVALVVAVITLPIWAITVMAAVKESEARVAESGGELHWSERARLTWSGRRLFLALAFVEGGVMALLALSWGGPFARIRGVPLGLGVGLVVLLVAVEVHRRLVLKKALGWRPSAGQVLAGFLVRGLWLAPVVPLVVVVLNAPARLLSWQMAVWLAALCLLSLGGLYGYGLYAARFFGAARPAPADIQRCVAELAERQGARVRDVFVVGWYQCNAIAAPLSGVIAVSSRAVEVLTPAQLRAILAHEVSHLAEPPAIRRARVLRGLLIPALALLIAAGAQYGASATLPLILLVFVFGRWLKAWLRTQEERADRGTHGDSPDYAGALEAVYRANAAPAVLRKAGTHPHLYDRLLAAGQVPDYPRPEPPPSASPALAVIVVFALLATIAGVNYLVGAPQAWLNADGAAAWRLSIGFSDPGRDLAQLGSSRIKAGQPGGIELYDAAEALSERPEPIWSQRVRDLAAVGQCDDADAHFQRIKRALTPHDLMSERWKDVRRELAACD